MKAQRLSKNEKNKGPFVLLKKRFQAKIFKKRQKMCFHLLIFFLRQKKKRLAFTKEQTGQEIAPLPSILENRGFLIVLGGYAVGKLVYTASDILAGNPRNAP